MKHWLVADGLGVSVLVALVSNLGVRPGDVLTFGNGDGFIPRAVALPGVDVVAKSDDTGTTFSAVTGANGAFTIPAMPIGRYTVTVSLTGFKTAVHSPTSA